jgi:hypothetical protein
MPRIVRCALIQASNALGSDRPLEQIRKAMIDKHLKMIEQAARKKAQILCLQELFYGPYFCAEQNARWYELTERVPDGPTTRLMQKIAAKHHMAIVVPVYEEQMAGVYFNTAAVIDADGKYLGKYRKHHIPHCHPGFWEKFYFTPGELPDCRNICGNSSNRHTPSRMDILLARSIAWELKNRGVLASSTARVTSAIREGRSSHRRAATRMKLSSPISTLT